MMTKGHHIFSVGFLAIKQFVGAIGWKVIGASELDGHTESMLISQF